MNRREFITLLARCDVCSANRGRPRTRSGCLALGDLAQFAQLMQTPARSIPQPVQLQLDL